MSCPDCAAAQTNPHHGGLHASCQGCQVRALASSPGFWESGESGALTPAYRAALESVFGAGWSAGHERVKAEHKRLQRLRGP